MYGIVNRSIEELVKANYGEAKWEAVKERSGIDVDFFISTEPYDDELTYKLARAVSDEINISLSTVLQLFGQWWILKTGKEKYGTLMQAGGEHLKEFLMNLPVFHNRIMLIYPKLTPPEFRVSNCTDNSIMIHYFSKRKGLSEFVRGLLMGLGMMYHTPVDVNLMESRDAGDDHEVFKVTW